MHCANFRFNVSILFLICIVTRLWFVGRYLDSCDSVDFALGLHDYDLSRLQPHFPGYPVYLFTSWLFSKTLRDDVLALIMPGVFFGSLTIYPLAFLARRLFSERVALLTAIFFLVNPLCWLQMEMPTSDAMGLFFVILSAYLLYEVLNLKISLTQRNRNVIVYHHVLLFLGSFVLGLGLGVRLSYFPFVASWMCTILYLALQGMCVRTNAIIYGLLGFMAGICLWLFPQTGYVGWHSFLQNGLSFSQGHFTDWGGSVITFGGTERIVCLVKSLWVYGLGGWWYDVSLLRLFPSAMMIVSLLYSFRQRHVTRQWWFLVVYVIPYLIWIILGQNVTNPRHVMPIIPVLLILISYGLCMICKEVSVGSSLVLLKDFFLIPYFVPTRKRKGETEKRRNGDTLAQCSYNQTRSKRQEARSKKQEVRVKEVHKWIAACVMFLTLAGFVSMSIISLKIVAQYHNNIPAPIQLIQFLERRFDSVSTRVYCGEEKRFFDYYAPLWDAREVRDAAGLNSDLQSSLCIPKNILLVYTMGKTKKFKPRYLPIISFKRDTYTDSVRDVLSLCTVNDL